MKPRADAIPNRPSCECCGEPARFWIRGRWARCVEHEARNPCAIDGCTRTTKAGKELRNDLWLCGVHWRKHCPPRSTIRGRHQRIFRLGKRHEWPEHLVRRYWRFWFWIVRRARQRDQAGAVDMAEVNRLFGWEQ